MDIPILDIVKRNATILIIFAILIVAIIIVVVAGSKRRVTEKLENISNDDDGKSHNMEMTQEEKLIKPTVYDAGSGTIMSGPEYIPSQYLSPWYQAYTGNTKNSYLLDDGEGGSAGLHFNMCSKSCCSDQYPLPFKMPVDSAVCENKGEFVPTNYSCNNAWQDSGCVCMTKNQSKFLGGRGGNA